MRTLLLTTILLPATLLAQALVPTNPLRFLALGDSYTIGQSVALNDRWPQQLSDSLASRNIITDTVEYIATTGWRTDNLLAAISGQNLQNKGYNLVSLLIGVNNQYQGKPFNQYTSEFPALLDSALRYTGNNKSRVFVVSIPDYAYTPAGQQSGDPAAISAQIDQYNAYNKYVTDSMGITYIDITAISRLGLQNPAYVATDGLHPSAVQYTQWVNKILAVIDSQVVAGYYSNSHLLPEPVLSPNPCQEEITIDNLDNEEQQLEIYNALGRRIQQHSVIGPVAYINVAGLPQGLYTLKLNSGKGYAVKKFVKAG